METQKDIKEIMNLLPHRYPFLLIDRVLEIDTDKIVAIKNVTINEPFFQGHFPNEPIMPGVLIVEAMAQAGGILYINSLPPEKYGAPVYFMAIDKAKFRKMVVPGDQITFEVEIIKRRAKAIKLVAVAKVDGAVVAQAELMATVGEKA
jgi:3-hydroxyacyl-[acyl-carrier-protein] dehydratase